MSYILNAAMTETLSGESLAPGIEITTHAEGLRWRARFAFDGQAFETDAWGTRDQALSQARQMFRSILSRGIKHRSTGVKTPMLVRGSVEGMSITMLVALARGLGIKCPSRLKKDELVAVLRPMLEETPVEELTV